MVVIIILEQKLNSAIIGCGNIYKAHADAIQNSKIAELIAVVDINEERAKKAAENYNVKFLTNYQNLRNYDIDIVHICTPHHLHVPMALNLMKFGYDVIVEKPIALNNKEAEKVIDYSKKRGRHLGVVFQNRFNKSSKFVKDIIKSNKKGKILGIKAFVTWDRDAEYYLKDPWRGTYNESGGGVLISQAIHTLDLVQWFGGEIEAVKGSIDTRVLDDIIEVEDTAETTLYFSNGNIGLFYASNCYSDNSSIEIEIHFEKGKIKIIGDKLFVDNKEIKFDSNKNDNISYKKYWGTSHQKLIEGFYKDIINKDNKYIIDGFEGTKSIKIIDGIVKSNLTGKKCYL